MCLSNLLQQEVTHLDRLEVIADGWVILELPCRNAAPLSWGVALHSARPARKRLLCMPLITSDDVLQRVSTPKLAQGYLLTALGGACHLLQGAPDGLSRAEQAHKKTVSSLSETLKKSLLCCCVIMISIFWQQGRELGPEEQVHRCVANHGQFCTDADTLYQVTKHTAGPSIKQIAFCPSSFKSFAYVRKGNLAKSTHQTTRVRLSTFGTLQSYQNI